MAPAKAQWVVLLLFSIAFYFVWGSWKGGIFVVSTVITTFFLARCMDGINKEEAAKIAGADHKLSRQEKKEISAVFSKRKRRYLLAGLFINFGILGVLKYTNFVIDNVNGVRGLLSQPALAHVSFLLPLGISFYTFQAMGYLIDVYRGRQEAETNLFKFALFVSYFPQVIQGPISKFSDLGPQLYAPHEFDAERFREGLLRLLWGFFKKVVIADRAAIVVTEVLSNYASADYKGFTVFFGLFLYGIQMYGDFSGGIDMVLGVSDMLGIRMMENFRQPYFSLTVSEFWQRWHISLGKWMMGYIFYPIALSKPFAKMTKKAKKRIGAYYGKILPAALASFIVFLVVGVWHGADWKFMAFGTYHAILTSADTIFERSSAKARCLLRIDGESFGWKVFQMIRTFFLITIGRYFDAAYTMHDALALLKRTFCTFNPGVLFDGSLYSMGVGKDRMTLLFFCVFILAIVDVINEKGHTLRSLFAKQGIVFRWIVYFGALFFILRFGIYGPGYNATAFLYQGF